MAAHPGSRIPTSSHERHDAALHIVRRYVIASAAVGIIPVPGLDVAVLAGLHIKLIQALTEHYGLTFSGQAARVILLAIGAGLLPASIASAATRRVVKFLPPGFGALTGLATSGLASYTLGRVMMAHFESGGTLDTFDVKNLGKLMPWRTGPGQALAPSSVG